MKSLKKVFGGIAIGFVNGLFGAGGGMLTVPLLKSCGYSQKDAQANAISIIFPLSIVSTVLYITRGHVTISSTLPYLPGGVLGAIAGTWLLKRFSPKWMRWIFAGFMIWAGMRMMLR